jgi:hypothetical protein
MIWSALFQTVFGAYLKGRSDAKAKVELKAAEKTGDAIQDANKAASDAADRAAAGKLRDSDFRD